MDKDLLDLLASMETPTIEITKHISDPNVDLARLILVEEALAKASDMIKRIIDVQLSRDVFLK